MDTSTLQAHSTPPGSVEELRQSLNALSRQAIQANTKESAIVLELVQSFRAWTERARFTGTDWCEDHHHQARELFQQLRDGVPSAQVMEKFLRLLLLTHRMLEKEKTNSAFNPEKETDAPPLFRRHVSRKTAPTRSDVLIPKASARTLQMKPGLMHIRTEDLGLFQIFLLDVPVLVEQAQAGLAEIDPEKNIDLGPLFRSFRGLRSTFGFLGFLGAWRLGRETERLLEPLTGGMRTMNENLKDTLSQVLSFFRAQTEQVEEGLSSQSVQALDPANLLDKLRSIPLPAISPEEVDKLHLEPESEPSFDLPALSTLVRSKQLDGLFENLVDLILSQNRILDDYRPKAKPQGLAEVAKIQKSALRLRDGILSLGMSPIEPVLAQAYQTAGALGRRKNQALEVTLEGVEVELDQRLLPELKEPLFHLIHNALDHAFESPRDRRARGKKAEGRLSLRARQKDGAFLLEVEDDGRGLDPEQIKRRAVELGWIQDEDIPHSQLLEFIFRPGFSPKNPRSAEGVPGLDSVRQKMESLLGSIRVQSRPGHGCKFTLKMPRSLALMDGWVVQAAGKKYLIPVAQTIKIEAADKVASARGDEVVSEMSLAGILGGAPDRPAERLAVLVEAGSNQVRLRVEEVSGKQQVLVKNNKEGFSVPSGVRAEALLADGNIGWILDIASLLREKKTENLEKGTDHGNEADGGL